MMIDKEMILILSIAEEYLTQATRSHEGCMEVLDKTGVNPQTVLNNVSDLKRMILNPKPGSITQIYLQPTIIQLHILLVSQVHTGINRVNNE